MQPLFLGMWENRHITIVLYEGHDHQPYAVAQGRSIKSENIFFGRIQGEELVAIIREVGRQIAEGELPLERRCSAVLLENGELHFMLPLLGACFGNKKQVAPLPPQNGGFSTSKDDLTLWPLEKMRLPPTPCTCAGIPTTLSLYGRVENKKVSVKRWRSRSSTRFGKRSQRPKNIFWKCSLWRSSIRAISLLPCCRPSIPR